MLKRVLVSHIHLHHAAAKSFSSSFSPVRAAVLDSRPPRYTSAMFRVSRLIWTGRARISAPNQARLIRIEERLPQLRPI